MSTVQEQEQKKKKQTKKYDEVASKIRKLLTATGASYIDDLCKALREDWYPNLTKDMVQDNKEVQSEIREKIMYDWSKDLNEEGIWSTRSIENWTPSWLKDPDRVIVAENREAARRAQKFAQEAQEQKTTLDKIANSLPEAPKFEEPKEESSEGIELEEQEEIATDPMLQSYGDTNKTIMGLYKDINVASDALWKALTQKPNMPHVQDDLINDHIKPTRDFRRTLAFELGKDNTQLHNTMAYIAAVVKDMITIIEEVDKR